MLTVGFTASGSAYYTAEVGTTRTAYYTDDATLGEPPGRWWGAGAQSLGLAGEVEAQTMAALFDRYLDPRDPRSHDRTTWTEAATIGRALGRYRSADEIATEMLAAEPDASPERVEEIRLAAAGKVRRPRTFVDLTYSPVKSVTVMHTAFAAREAAARRTGDAEAEAAWRGRREAVEHAVWAGNDAMLRYMSRHAGYSRIGHHGGAGGRWTDAHDWTVAQFFQHTNRAEGPQLHVHNVVLSRVQCPDGQWRSLDHAAIVDAHQAGGAIGDRVTEVELGRLLGAAFDTRADGVCRESTQVSEAVLTAFSPRRTAIVNAARPLIEAYEARVGRPATALEQTRIMRSVAMASRPGKQHNGEGLAERAERMDRQMRAEVGAGLHQLADDLVANEGTPPEAEPFDPRAVITEAMAQASATGATWTRYHLTRHITAALPALGDLAPDEVESLIEGLVDEALTMAERGEHRDPIVGASSRYGAVSVSGSTADVLPDELRLADGRSALTRPTERRYAAEGTIAAELALRQAAIRTSGRVADPAAVDGWLARRRAAGLTLGADQEAAIRGVLTGGQQLSVIVGPAGTGKSRVAAVLAQAWTDPELWDGAAGRLIGLTISQTAANNLATDGVPALNVARWLGIQRRLAAGTAHGDDWNHRLTADDVIVVDEAGMADTDALREIEAYVQTAGARWVWAGDHRQLGAIGAGGMMASLVGAAPTYELTTVRRFANRWEAQASLRLRDGDTSALLDYERHGRIVSAGSLADAEAQAARGWLADTVSGVRSLLVVDTNEQAARLSASLRDELIALSRVQPDGVHLPRQNTIAGVGDIIVTRANNYRLDDETGRPAEVANRQLHRVVTTREDGTLVVEPDGCPGRRVVLPAGYVETSVELGYAVTVHACQGATEGTTHSVVSSRSRLSSLYVQMTRGRERNTVYAETATSGESERTALEVLASAVDRPDEQLAAVDQAAVAVDRSRSVQTLVEEYAAGVEQVQQARIGDLFDRLTVNGLLGEDERVAVAADPATQQLGWLLRSVELAGHDVDRVVTEAVDGRPLTGARSIAQVLHARINDAMRGQLTPTVETVAEAVPTVDGTWGSYLSQLAEAVDDRRRQLGTETAENLPVWATETLGPVPTGPADRLEWEHRAGAVAAYRELTGHTDEENPIPPAPAAGMTEHRAAWAAAWRALGRPELGRDEAEMSEGQLRVRVRAWEREQTWAPGYVGAELKATAEAAARCRQEAAMAAARATVEVDEGRRRELLAEAEQRRALADVLAEAERQLDVADEGRGAWYAHTAPTRQAAERAASELKSRGVDLDASEERVTAAEWLEAERLARLEDDAHRPVAEADVTDDRDAVDEADRNAAGESESSQAERDDADQAAAEPADDKRQSLPDRVPSPAETAAAALRAREALRRIEERKAEEEAKRAAEAEEEEELREAARRRRDQIRAAEWEDADVR
ncbi:relaxase domain-containing protein [Planosporangium thailandense]|uniref:Relaxase domain-containing protein n=1 Tax=Planosporangium thailandense TaxID=765197 RepID=A0ABX0XZR9_9ACTN|nr:MobF family relaxase [Planosporangium thailandense]NJC70840.1 relaxase domain-containing protein [Planosporangium thailandense]